MTAYELFKRTYYHYSGNFMRHLWTANKGISSPKAYITESFKEALGEYSIIYAYPVGFKLIYNPANSNVKDLSQIEMQSGYYLCYCNGNTDEWLAMYYDSRLGAKKAYTMLSMQCFKNQDWFWIVKIE